MVVGNISYLELAKNKYPNMTEQEIIKSCPHTLGVMHIPCSTCADFCIDCWNHNVDEYDLRKA